MTRVGDDQTRGFRDLAALAALKTAADRFGGDLDAWPTEARAAAEALLARADPATRAAAEAALAAAAALDRRLETWAAAPPPALSADFAQRLRTDAAAVQSRVEAAASARAVGAATVVGPVAAKAPDFKPQLARSPATAPHASEPSRSKDRAALIQSLRQAVGSLLERGLRGGMQAGAAVVGAAAAAGLALGLTGVGALSETVLPVSEEASIGEVWDIALEQSAEDEWGDGGDVLGIEAPGFEPAGGGESDA